MTKPRPTRAQRRANLSDIVCREVRFQMAEHGGIADNVRLNNLLGRWMRVAKKNKYLRPES